MTEYISKFTIQAISMLSCFMGILLSAQVAAEVITSEEAETGLRVWEWREAGVSLQLVQRLPDQTRAFFQGRGFNNKDADTIGRACVFQSIFRNDGTETMTYDFDMWYSLQGAKRYPLLTREHWDKQWQAGGVSQAARIAFRWSLLPSRQSFEPGDYNWGMTSFGLPAGEAFDLMLVIVRNGRQITSTITDVVCAHDKSVN